MPNRVWARGRTVRPKYKRERSAHLASTCPTGHTATDPASTCPSHGRTDDAPARLPASASDTPASRSVGDPYRGAEHPIAACCR